MAAPSDYLAFDQEQAIAAAGRWEKRETQHEKFEDAVREKKYSQLDTKERMAARANRLLKTLDQKGARSRRSKGFDAVESAVENLAPGEVSAENVNDEMLERIIGATRDFLFIDFLEKALRVSRAVSRIVTKLPDGRTGFGTGFLVTPRLLLTNHHVLPTQADAVRSVAEFDYQRLGDGGLSTPRKFALDPDALYLSDAKLDFALVAVDTTRSNGSLATFGSCPLIGTIGKIVSGEPINIIQHPKGEPKQVVIRENRLIDALDGHDLFLHYAADTEPGSSGSPVFNDQWEVVALHHSGVPKRNAQKQILDVDGRVWRGGDPTRIAWVANEGVRISKIVDFIKKARPAGVDMRLIDELLVAGQGTESDQPFGDAMPTKSQPDHEVPDPEDSDLSPALNSGEYTVTINVPLEITIRVPSVVVHRPGDIGAHALDAHLERVEPDPSDKGYERRPGYQENFLGFEVPFPQLTTVTRKQAFERPGVSGVDRFMLHYHHYSVIMNKDRKLAFVAGVNYNPVARFHHKRDQADKWFFDPRVGKNGSFQAGEDLYARNPLDRGHLVRRADAGWGDTAAEAKLANDDTFHFTNCSPQHAITNQGKVSEAPPGLKLWGKLEDHVASQGKKNKRKLCVFNGPVFRRTDEPHRGVRIPREFWKLVVFEDDDGNPAAASFILTQAELIQDLREKFDFDEYKTVQVSVADLETKTRLNFGVIRDLDVLERALSEKRLETETDLPAVVLESLSDVIL